jgi:hypothetical protein
MPTLSITRDTYSHVLPALQEDAANKVAQLMRRYSQAGACRRPRWRSTRGGKVALDDSGTPGKYRSNMFANPLHP